MSAGKQSDAALFEAGRRARSLAQCASVIVATSPEGVRNYHQCIGDSNHTGPGGHYCGCDQQWRLEPGVGWVSTGPLTDVVFAS